MNVIFVAHCPVTKYSAICKSIATNRSLYVYVCIHAIYSSRDRKSPFAEKDLFDGHIHLADKTGIFYQRQRLINRALVHKMTHFYLLI